MKTPIDSTGNAGATLALLNSGADFQMCSLYSITLNGGTVIRWHDAGYNTPLVFTAASPYGGTYNAGPLIDRGNISTKIGLEVATFDMTISATLTDLINGVALIPFAQGRGFDGATVLMQRAFLTAWGQPILGTVIDFSGRVTALKDVQRTKFTMTVSAWTVLLNVNMGPDIFQAGCLNSHYDADCGLVEASFTFSGTVTGAGSPLGCNSNLTNADGYFSKGKLTWLTGANAGLLRAVSTYVNAGGALTFAYRLPNAPSVGDTFTVSRGCLLTTTDCNTQGNLLKFRGQPYTPPAITGVLS